MKNILLTIAVASLLTACHSLSGSSNSYIECNSKASCNSDTPGLPAEVKQASVQAATSSQQQPEPQYGATVFFPFTGNQHSHKQLSDYASQMSMQLVETLHAFPVGAKIAIASFVELGPELDVSNSLGNQLAESFIHQMQQYGLAVADFKTTNNIRVTKHGDFIFSREHSRLQTSQKIDYVLAGTMLYTPKGIMVNARVIHFDSKVVAASAQQLIPHFVISALYPITEG